MLMLISQIVCTILIAYMALIAAMEANLNTVTLMQLRMNSLRRMREKDGARRLGDALRALTLLVVLVLLWL